MYGYCSKLYIFMTAMRNREWGEQLTRLIFSKLRTTLILFGDTGTTTSWHIDWIRAFNWAILVLKVGLGGGKHNSRGLFRYLVYDEH